MTAWLVLIATVITCAIAYFGWFGRSDDSAAVADPRWGAATQEQITELLAQVDVVAARPNVPGYQRSCDADKACSFGPAWTDDHDGLGGHNGCGTRDDILAAQLTDVGYKDAKRCVVVSGELDDPYTGVPGSFQKANASAVQIDHVYPLARAWDMGAAKWSQQRRVDFANDEASNLLAVDGPTNGSKGDSGPGEWLPPNGGFHCRYVVLYLSVAQKYDLPITTADRDAIVKVQSGCPTTP